jgi:hypothetical protein
MINFDIAKLPWIVHNLQFTLIYNFCFRRLTWFSWLKPELSGKPWWHFSYVLALIPGLWLDLPWYVTHVPNIQSNVALVFPNKSDSLSRQPSLLPNLTQLLTNITELLPNLT